MFYRTILTKSGIQKKTEDEDSEGCNLVLDLDLQEIMEILPPRNYDFEICFGKGICVYFSS